MKFRTFAVAGGLAVALLTGGCAKTVAGQAEIVANAAAIGTSGISLPATSIPSLPTASGGGSSVPQDTAQGGLTSSQDSTTAPDTETPAPRTSTSASSPKPPAKTSAPPTSQSDESVPPLTGPTSIPGLSGDCNKVLAAISAFSSVLQGVSSGADTTISQASVDAALKQLPASGLPPQPQADITVLRTTIAGAGGKTVTELALTMTDGKVVAALEDLSNWATKNCT